MNKVYLIIATGNYGEDTCIISGNTNKEEAERIIEDIEKLLDYCLNKSLIRYYSEEEDVLRDIEYFKENNPEFKVNITQELIDMLMENKNSWVNYVLTIKEVVIQ